MSHKITHIYEMCKCIYCVSWTNVTWGMLHASETGFNLKKKKKMQILTQWGIFSLLYYRKQECVLGQQNMAFH